MIRTVHHALLEEMVSRLVMFPKEDRWTHDCSMCEYLGTIRNRKHPEQPDADVYRQCRRVSRTGEKRYLIRYSDDPSDYTSDMDVQGTVNNLFFRGYI